MIKNLKGLLKMEIFKVSLMSCPLSVVAASRTCGYSHPERITAEGPIKRDALNHNEDFACSGIDPRCH